MLLRELPYLETHLTDHCTLACRGCAHYSPLAKEHFTDLDRYDKDMRRLAQLFRTIRVIRLMGGEPLLHPEAEGFVRRTCTAFPRSRIAVVTNGILLEQVASGFWDAVRDTATEIHLTVYPPLKGRADALAALCRQEGARFRLREVDRFRAYGNLAGDSDTYRAFEACRLGYYCRFLQDGRVYRCAMSARVGDFNEAFGRDIPVDGGIDIHAASATGRGIVRELNTPSETCRWCSYEPATFAWRSGRCRAEDWDARAQTAYCSTCATLSRTP